MSQLWTLISVLKRKFNYQTPSWIYLYMGYLDETSIVLPQNIYWLSIIIIFIRFESKKVPFKLDYGHMMHI